MQWNIRRKELGLCVALSVLVLIVGSLTVPWTRWREHVVYQALYADQSPGFWWPPAWREEFRTSILFEGYLTKSKKGTLELSAGSQGLTYRTDVEDGRFSFHPRVLPAGLFKARLLAPDGSSSQWMNMGPLDPGRHRFSIAL
jgi:hypothetical protein